MGEEVRIASIPPASIPQEAEQPGKFPFAGFLFKELADGHTAIWVVPPYMQGISKAISASYTILTLDGISHLDVTTGTSTIDVTLPDRNKNQGRFLSIRKADAAVGTARFVAAGTDTIDGDTSISVMTRRQRVVLFAGPTEWEFVSGTPQQVTGEPPLGSLHLKSSDWVFADILNAGISQTWTDVDVSSFVPVGTTAILCNLICGINTNLSGSWSAILCCRKKGSTPLSDNATRILGQQGNNAASSGVELSGQGIIFLDSNRKFQYRMIVSNAVGLAAYITFVGYYHP